MLNNIYKYNIKKELQHLLLDEGSILMVSNIWVGCRSPYNPRVFIKCLCVFEIYFHLSLKEKMSVSAVYNMHVMFLFCVTS